MSLKKITLVLTLIFTIILILGYWSSDREEPIRPNEANDKVYAGLVKLGIRDAVVDITPERALVRYNLPENMSKVEMRYHILWLIAGISPNSSKIVIQVYENFTPLEEVIVSTEDVLAFMNETITYEELQKRIEIRSLK